MYLYKQKHILIVFLLIVHCFSLFSQEDRSTIDTVMVRQDSLAVGTLLMQHDSLSIDTVLVQQDSLTIDTSRVYQRKTSSNAIESKVTYSAQGYIKRDILNRKVILVQSAVVNYGDIEVKADSIAFDMETNILFASGRPDTTGILIGTPAFKEKSQEFQSEELSFNFKTRKAFIKNIVTKQNDGLLHSTYTKLLEDGTSNILKNTYSTCDADTPHFYINMPRARVYPGEKIVSGPGNLVLEGVPLPIVLPFGYFPIQTKRAASGLIIPKIGETSALGFSLTDGGYYFAINDYFDLALRGNVYSNGTWLLTAQTDYNRLYRYRGNFTFSYANNNTGHKGLEDFSQSSNYRVAWTYAQDAKSSPGSRFSASVNMSSSGYDRKNSYVVEEHVTTQRQSSISYSKSWTGTPFNLSASMNHSQNVKNKTVALNLPKVSFSAGRIYPLKRKNSSGSSKWYEEIQFQYTASLDNQINTYDTLLFTPDVFKNMKNGFKHSAPLSFQIRPFTNFSISPALTYTGVLYTQKIVQTFVPDYQDPVTGEIKSTVVIDTLKGAFYGHAFSPSISAGYSPSIFGSYKFKNPDSRVMEIRHVIKPAVTFSYIPYFKGLSSKMYRQVQLDTTGIITREYSIFEGGIYGTPSLSRESGNVGFNLVNILEGKVFARNDTTGKPNKVKIIDNFGISTSYNIFADSNRWAPVSMVFRTRILDKINISANSSFTLYGVDSKGNTIKTFAFAQNRKLMRLNSFSTGLDFSLSDLLKKKTEKSTTGSSQTSPQTSPQTDPNRSPLTPGANQSLLPHTALQRDEYGYSVFNVPWSLNIRYSLNYYKTTAPKPTISQTLSFNGDVKFTKKMSLTYTSGYDFKVKQITMTQISMTRDLHCWLMSFNWVPNGTMKSWNFAIRVKSSVLADLKYERKKDFRDSY